MEALKHQLGERAIERIATRLQQAHPDFDALAFTRAACAGLDALELKARVLHVAETLAAHLPPGEDLEVLVRAGAAWERQDEASFAAWPLIEYVGLHGLDRFDEGMEALRRLTHLFSSEFAIRAFLERDEARALRTMTRWTEDEDEAVRRLVSEGSRPRLPWGRRLQRFVRDPAPVLALLERLKDDPSEFVRRSVANNLNDIAKDHPDLVVEVCARWAEEESRAWIVRHATRTLVKQGHEGALTLRGYSPRAAVEVEALRLAEDKITLGEDLVFSFALRSSSTSAQPLMVDFAVHHVKASGERQAKVFKLKTLELAPGAHVRVEKRHRIRSISTRTYYAGRHALEILVNGRARGLVEFDLAL